VRAQSFSKVAYGQKYFFASECAISVSRDPSHLMKLIAVSPEQQTWNPHNISGNKSSLGSAIILASALAIT
jgi:hypothetical protein